MLANSSCRKKNPAQEETSLANLSDINTISCIGKTLLPTKFSPPPLQKGVMARSKRCLKMLKSAYPVVGRFNEVREDLMAIYLRRTQFICHLSKRVTKSSTLRMVETH